MRHILPIAVLAAALLAPLSSGAQATDTPPSLADVRARVEPALRAARDTAARRALADSLDFAGAVHLVALLRADGGATPALDSAVHWFAWADSAAPASPLRTMLRRLGLAYRAYGRAMAPGATRDCAAVAAVQADLREAGRVATDPGSTSPLLDAALQYEGVARKRLARPESAACATPR